MVERGGIIARIGAALLALLLAAALLAFLSGEGGGSCLPAVVFFLIALIAFGSPPAPLESAIASAFPARLSARSPPSPSSP
jgi:hypothetical protein